MSRLRYWSGVIARTGWVAGDIAHHIAGAITALPNPVKLAKHVPYLLAPGVRESIEFWPAHEAARSPEQSAALSSLFAEWRDALKADGLVVRDFSLAPINSGILIPEDRTEITPQRVFNNLAERHIALHANEMAFPDGYEFTDTVRYQMTDAGKDGITIKFADKEPTLLANYMFSQFLPSFCVLVKTPSNPEQRWAYRQLPDVRFAELAARKVFEGKLTVDGFKHEGVSADGKSASLLQINDYFPDATAEFADRLTRRLHNPRLTLKDWG